MAACSFNRLHKHDGQWPSLAWPLGPSTGLHAHDSASKILHDSNIHEASMPPVASLAMPLHTKVVLMQKSVAKGGKHQNQRTASHTGFPGAPSPKSH
eukprot:scaffold218541_cov17-Tisochrysis_lutea.AAC.2